MAIQTHLHTVDAFERILALPENSERLLELINGEIVEKMPTEEHGIIVLRIGSRILIFVDTNHLGRVGVEIRHRNPEDHYNDRLPDISFTADTTAPVVTQGAVLRFPDLAVEVKSPSDSYRQMRDKAEFYLANRVKLVWLVYPEKRIVESYRADREIEMLNEHETLEGGDVLPGFSMALSEIFKR
ncbi:MAG: Uma2 family endonuclease [Chloroflexota bacterium]